ncbi:MAG: LysM peptidoglycan-binding domain-containing protein, partial [Chitinophagaceae bacterium]|nr:LysM peptidoglycan-binding domain-containing protein [Chitinophagaceae bacterium]
IFPAALSVTDQLEIFRHSILQYQGDIHRPYYLKIHWGTLLFKGVLTSMDIEFRLFSPDGSPLRAIAKCAFKGSVDENLRLAIENRMSPDITHKRFIKSSDRLPLLVQNIYNEQRHYVDVARFNKLDGFRKIDDGTEIKLPPTQ